MSFQTRKTFVHLQNTNWDIFAGIWELSDMINAQKSSKDICKIIHVTSGIQPQFYEATRILFVRKENN